MAGEGIRGEVKDTKARRDVAGELAGEEVVGEIEDLKVGEVGQCRREAAGKGVVLEVDSA